MEQGNSSTPTTAQEMAILNLLMEKTTLEKLPTRPPNTQATHESHARSSHSDNEREMPQRVRNDLVVFNTRLNQASHCLQQLQATYFSLPAHVHDHPDVSAQHRQEVESNLVDEDRFGPSDLRRGIIPAVIEATRKLAADAKLQLEEGDVGGVYISLYDCGYECMSDVERFLTTLQEAVFAHVLVGGISELSMADVQSGSKDDEVTVIA